MYSKKPILADIKRRLQTVVIPYFSFGLLIFLYWALLERYFRDSSMTVMESFFGLLRGQYDYLDFNVHLWFLPCFFMTVVLYNVFMSIDKKVAYGAVILISVVYIISPLPQLPWGIDRIFKYVGFYAAGNVLAEKHLDKVIKNISVENRFFSSDSVNNRVITAKLYICVGVLVIVLILSNFLLSYFDLSTGVMWFVTGMSGVTGIWVLSLLVNYNKVLQYFGRMSLIVLCVHGPVYRIVIKVLSISLRIDTDILRSNFPLAMLVVIVTLVTCCMVYEIVLRIAPWMIGKKRVR